MLKSREMVRAELKILKSIPRIPRKQDYVLASVPTITSVHH